MSKKLKAILWVGGIGLITSIVGLTGNVLNIWDVTPIIESMGGKLEEVSWVTIGTSAATISALTLRSVQLSNLAFKRDTDNYNTNRKLKSEQETREVLQAKMEQDNRIEAKLNEILERDNKKMDAISKMKHLPEAIKESFLDISTETITDVADVGQSALETILDSAVDKLDDIVETGVDKIVDKLV